ncbi:MAG: ABC transporter permease [Devosia sp.]
MKSRGASYLRAIGNRLAAGIPIFLIVTFLATLLSDLTPGSAAQAILGELATSEQVAQLNARYGFDRPAWERHIDWLGKLFQGDLGRTMYSQQPVAQLLLSRALVTFELAFGALALALLIAVPLAMVTSVRAGGRLDSIVQAVTAFILAIPVFVTVVVLGLFFSITLRWLPATGWVSFADDPLGNLRYAALPILCLAFGQTAYLYRVARNEFLSTLQEDFVLVARAKGMPISYIMFRHVLRPSLPQLATVIGLSMTSLLGGSFMVESFFAVPGIGWTMLDAVNTHDFPVLQAILSLTVVIFVVIYMLMDLAYAIIDPRVEVQ